MGQRRWPAACGTPCTMSVFFRREKAFSPPTAPGHSDVGGPRTVRAPGSHYLAAVTSIFDGHSDGSLARWKRHDGAIDHIAVARAGIRCASAGNDGTVSLSGLAISSRRSSGPNVISPMGLPIPVSAERRAPHHRRTTVDADYSAGTQCLDLQIWKRATRMNGSANSPPTASLR